MQFDPPPTVNPKQKSTRLRKCSIYIIKLLIFTGSYLLLMQPIWWRDENVRRKRHIVRHLAGSFNYLYIFYCGCRVMLSELLRQGNIAKMGDGPL